MFLCACFAFVVACNKVAVAAVVIGVLQPGRGTRQSGVEGELIGGGGEVG